jgi:hypothetical protein
VRRWIAGGALRVREFTATQLEDVRVWMPRYSGLRQDEFH